MKSEKKKDEQSIETSIPNPVLIQEDGEEYLWQRILIDDTLGAYRHYLRKYPLGKFVKEANEKIDAHEHKIKSAREYVKKKMDEAEKSVKNNTETKTAKTKPEREPGDFWLSLFVGLIIALFVTFGVMIIIGVIKLFV